MKELEYILNLKLNTFYNPEKLDDDKLTEEQDLISQSLEEKEYTIKALIQLTGKKEDDVEKIVKMAKGLKTEENSIEEKIEKLQERKKNLADDIVKSGENFITKMSKEELMDLFE